MEKLITPKEAAEILGVCRKTLARIIATGQLPYINVGIGVMKPRRMFHPEDLAAFIAERRRQDFPPTPYEGRRLRVRSERVTSVYFKVMRNGSTS